MSDEDDLRSADRLSTGEKHLVCCVLPSVLSVGVLGTGAVH